MNVTTVKYWPINKAIPRGWKKADTELGNGRLIGSHGQRAILIEKVRRA